MSFSETTLPAPTSMPPTFTRRLPIRTPRSWTVKPVPLFAIAKLSSITASPTEKKHPPSPLMLVHSSMTPCCPTLTSAPWQLLTSESKTTPPAPSAHVPRPAELGVESHESNQHSSTRLSAAVARSMHVVCHPLKPPSSIPL